MSHAPLIGARTPGAIADLPEMPLPAAIVGFALGCCVLLGASIAGDRWVVVAALLAVLATVIAIVHTEAVALIVIGTIGAGIRLPDGSGQLRLTVLLGTLLAVAALTRYALGARRAAFTTIDRWTLAFVGVVLVTVAARGIGFRALGGDSVGGLIYVKLLAAASMVIVLPRLRLSGRALRLAFLAACAASFLPLLADLGAVYVPSIAPTLRRWIALSPSVELLLRGTPPGPEGLRWTSAMPASVFLTMAILLGPAEARHLTLRRAAAAAFAGVGLAAFSGHRIALLLVLGIVALALAWDGKLQVRHLLTVALAGVALLALVAAISPHLPLPVQRAISWIPGASIADGVRQTSNDTVLWRVAVWLVAAQEVPKFLVLGRGLAYSDGAVAAAANANVVAEEANWAIVAGYFHNGILSLLILFGVPGLITGAGICVSAVRRARAAIAASWQTHANARLCRVLAAWLVVQVMEFWLLYGDVQVSFPDLFITLGLIEAARRSDAPSLATAASERAGA